ncbi:MAG: hypothetical protein H6719_31990 [Sandaracinaceae bacterium]|nr:hypothetical protein [Sandaracinaceae bacterium]
MNRLALTLAALALAACTSPLELGQECSDSNDCLDGLACFFTDGTMSRSVCMSECDDSTTRLCELGEVCIPATLMGVPRDRGVCFLGGEATAGMPCVDTFDCARGTLCVSVSDVQTCYRACTVGAEDDPCFSNEVCQALVGMGTNGYCAPIL